MGIHRDARTVRYLCCDEILANEQILSERNCECQVGGRGQRTVRACSTCRAGRLDSYGSSPWHLADYRYDDHRYDGYRQVRHPKVKQRIFMDFKIMRKLAAYADRTPSLKWMNLGPSMEQFSHTMAAQASCSVACAQANCENDCQYRDSEYLWRIACPVWTLDEVSCRQVCRSPLPHVFLHLVFYAATVVRGAVNASCGYETDFVSARAWRGVWQG